MFDKFRFVSNYLAGLQMGIGVFMHIGYFCNQQFITTGFGITSIITGIIGLTLTFRMHFSALNGTYMTCSAINVTYASFHAMRFASLRKLFCKFIGATAMACLGISLVAIVFCMKTNICCPSCHAYGK